MEDIIALVLLSLAMLVGCYLSGMIPLAITLSEEKLKFVTVFGAGLLVGTALAVIIPEGIHAMSETGHSHAHHETEHKEVAVNANVEEHKHKDEGHHEHSVSDNHTIIGVTLVAGFIFMLLVDQIGGGHSHSSPDVESSTGPQSIVHQNRHKITATLGLVVHAAADGVAMGAAVMMQRSHLTIIVFIAIMLHKAPAAFGLVSFLLHDGFDRNRIRKHLLVFAAAAPVMAIFTYIALSISQGQFGKMNDNKTTGVAMLFSAGTFLYVATVHVLPEVASTQSRQTTTEGTTVIHEHKGFRNIDLVAIVFGSILPVLLSLGHEH